MIWVTSSSVIPTFTFLASSYEKLVPAQPTRANANTAAAANLVILMARPHPERTDSTTAFSLYELPVTPRLVPIVASLSSPLKQDAYSEHNEESTSLI